MFDFLNFVHCVTDVSRGATIGFQDIILVVGCILVVVSLVQLLAYVKDRYRRRLGIPCTLLALGVGCLGVAYFIHCTNILGR